MAKSSIQMAYERLLGYELTPAEAEELDREIAASGLPAEELMVLPVDTLYELLLDEVGPTLGLAIPERDARSLEDLLAFGPLADGFTIVGLDDDLAAEGPFANAAEAMLAAERASPFIIERPRSPIYSYGGLSYSLGYGYDHYGFGYGYPYGVTGAAAKKFVKQAQKLVDTAEPEAEHVPLIAQSQGLSTSYGQDQYLTYADTRMTAAQKRWYFYWRAQARQGTFLKADPGYPLIYIYELINDIGVASPQDGFERLLALYHHYAPHAIGLYRYLSTWIEDYALIHTLADGAETIREARVRNWVDPGYGEIPDPVIAYYVDRPLREMPLAIIAELSEWKVDSSFFLASERNQELVGTLIPGALEAVNAKIAGTGTRGIFQRHGPRDAGRTTKRKAFNGAIYAGSRVMVEIPTVPCYHNRKGLTKVLKGIVKHTENRLRERVGVTSKLRGYEISEKNAAVIDAFLAEHPLVRALPPLPPKGKKVKPRPVDPDRPTAPLLPADVRIDPTRVETLVAQSNAVRDLLLDGLEEAAATTGSDPRQSVDSDGRAGLEPGRGEATRHIPPVERPLHTPAGEEGSADPWEQLGQRLSPAQTAVLRAMVTRNEARGAIRGLADAEGMMPEVLLDAINETALETVGDAVIDLTGESPAIYEEYRDPLTAALNKEQVQR